MSKTPPRYLRKSATGSRSKSGKLLFIDDLAENLETPRKSGWRTLHLPPGTDLEKELLTFQISGIKKT
jgi:FMN phosphatase YigB (HAD superfamily)